MHQRHWVFIVLFLSHLASISWATLCVAHRGNSSRYLENSFEAIDSAYEIGTPAIEFDVQHTRDGIGILMHDNTLRKTAINQPGKWCDYSTPIQKQSFVDIDQACLLKNREAIPTLKEVLNTFEYRESQLFVELKDSPSKTTMSLLIEFEKASPGKLFVISFKDSILDKLKRNPFIKQNIPMLHISSYPDKVSLKYQGVAVKAPNENYLKFWKEKKKVTNVWTINEPKLLKRYIKWQVDYLTTDKPLLCMKLNRR